MCNLQMLRILETYAVRLSSNPDKRPLDLVQDTVLIAGQMTFLSRHSWLVGPE
jgi:hypothetical protein